MTASPIPPEPTPFTSPVIDYEPPAEPLGRRLGVRPCPPSPCPSGGRYPQSREALHRRSPRRLVPVPHTAVRDQLPPRAVVAFADAALRRVLEVVDRRRPVAQLRPVMTPALIDTVLALARRPHTATATLQRVRLRMIDGDGSDVPAAEVFATYTRGERVRAIAAKVERRPVDDRWRIVALQIG